jgi:drug/metabolite transporter (DMT)-like permease
MTWQLFSLLYLILGTATYLLQRRLAQTLAQHKRLVSGFFFLVVHYPVGLAVAAFSSPSLSIGWQNALLLLVGSCMFPAINLIALRASKDIDAGSYSILSNLTPIITIVSAYLLLNERLTHAQLLGAAITILSAFLITLPSLRGRSKNRNSGLVFALGGIFLLGLATVYERWMLTRVGLGAYLIFGWGAQSLWMALIAWPERKHFKVLRADKNFVTILSYSLAGSLKGVCFIAALKLGNASLVAAFTSFIAIMVVPAAYFILRERQWLKLKISASAAGTLGLIILNTGWIK